MYNKFGEITQPFITDTSSKKNTRVLALITLHEARGDNPKKAFIVMSCVVYSIYKKHVCIDYLAFLSKQLSEISVGYRGGYKYEDKSFNIILGIGNPDLLI